MTASPPQPLIQVELECRHFRRIQPGLHALVQSGRVNLLLCLQCMRDRPVMRQPS